MKEEVPDDLETATILHIKQVYEKYDHNLTLTAKALNAAKNTVRTYLEK